MRLEIKTAKNHGINLHLLFSPDDPHHESTIERILGRLHFRFQEQDYACNRQELIALGRAYDPKQTDEDGAHRTGANLFKVSFPELQKLFREEQKWLSKNCLVADVYKRQAEFGQEAGVLDDQVGETDGRNHRASGIGLHGGQARIHSGIAPVADENLGRTAGEFRDTFQEDAPGRTANQTGGLDGDRELEGAVGFDSRPHVELIDTQGGGDVYKRQRPSHSA